MTEEERLLLEARVRRGKSDAAELAAAVLARAGRRVLMVRAGGQQSVILPFKRSAAVSDGSAAVQNVDAFEL